jgi:hypothetical protein
LRLTTWRCDDEVDLAGVVSAWWCKKHAVEAMSLCFTTFN